MPKKKGAAAAAKARARRERKDSPPPASVPVGVTSGPIVPADGRRAHRGLQNLGNTCFMNSVLQCLNVSVPFSDELMRLAEAGAGDVTGALCSVFYGIRGLGDASTGAFSPKRLHQELKQRFPWYRGKAQHDAHELLRTLLASISDETTLSEANQEGKTCPNSLAQCVRDSFRGHLCAATLCWGCCKVSMRLDPFLDICLDLPALSGQQVGALGLAPSATSPEPLRPEASPSNGSDDVKKQEEEAKQKPTKPAPKKAPAVRGAWAAKQDAAARVAMEEEYMVSVRSIVARIVRRVAIRKFGVDEEIAEEEVVPPESVEEPALEVDEEAPTVEIELSRKSKRLCPSWGFQWVDWSDGGEKFVLAGVAEDTPLDKWNLRRRTTGDDDLVVCVGDRLIRVNCETDPEVMAARLKSEDLLQLQFERRAPGAGPLNGNGRRKDDEADRKAELAAAREERRQAFCENAARVQESLAPELQDAFGPAASLSKSSKNLVLEDCLRQFSTVEALEDDFKPSYRCARCGVDGSKSYASRRMWIWPVKLPPVLTLQLKRFRRYMDRFEKSVASVALPMVLDVSRFVLTESEFHGLQSHVAEGLELKDALLGGSNGSSLCYELYGICVHTGSMKGGHYIAFVNAGPSLEAERWVGISDARVWNCDREEMLKAEAYVAFYRVQGTTA